MSPPPREKSVVDALIEEHSDRAYSAALRLTNDPTEAQDLVQEAFLRALQKAALYDRAFDFGGWLHRILYRVFLNRRRSALRRREVSLEPLPDSGAALLDTLQADPAQAPESALEREDMRKAVRRCLDRLAAQERACVVLVDIEGRSYQEAADILGWPVGTVAGRLFRARRLLRGWLKEGAQ